MPALVPIYEDHMNSDKEWALTQSSLFFEGRGCVQDAFRRFNARLKDLGVPYAIIGGMAQFHHGYRRYTSNINVLVTRDGLKRILQELPGNGYYVPFVGSKHLRDADNGVKIAFVNAGEYPGDGKPKPVAFPDPAKVTIEARRHSIHQPAGAHRTQACVGDDERRPPEGLG